MPATTERLHGEETQALAIRGICYLEMFSNSRGPQCTYSREEEDQTMSTSLRQPATCTHSQHPQRAPTAYRSWMQNLGCCDHVCLWEGVAKAVVGNLKTSVPAHPARRSSG